MEAMAEVCSEKKRKEKAEARQKLPFLARIRIDRDLPRMNQILGNAYKKRIPYSAVVEEWRKKLYGIQLEQLGPDWMNSILVNQKHPQRRLEVIRRCKRKLDRTNLWSNTKAPEDALKSYTRRMYGQTIERVPGWYYDDSDTYLDLHVVEIVTGEKPWIEISLFGNLEKPNG